MPYGMGGHEPGGYGGLGGGPIGYKREGRGWNTNWMRYNMTREGRGSGYGPGGWKSVRAHWLKGRYQKAMDRLERTPYIGPAYRGAKKVNKNIDNAIDRELSHIPGYAKVSARQRMLIRNGLKGWLFETVTSPGLDKMGWGWFPDLPVGPSVPLPKSLTRSRWFNRRKRYYNRRRRY